MCVDVGLLSVAGMYRYYTGTDVCCLAMIVYDIVVIVCIIRVMRACVPGVYSANCAGAWCVCRDEVVICDHRHPPELCEAVDYVRNIVYMYLRTP